MQGLYPIIRRKRVPLLPVDVPPAAAANVESVNAEAVRAKAAMEAKGVEGASTPPLPQEETD